jgi:hypothetical protein
MRLAVLRPRDQVVEHLHLAVALEQRPEPAHARPPGLSPAMGADDRCGAGGPSTSALRGSPDGSGQGGMRR